MTLLDRARTLMERVRSNTRAYRFEGEQANHARQLAETKASIAGFERVEQDPEATPEARYWLNQHRAGMEDRLAVFEAKPRLTVEEMNERDAIETHLYGAPLPRQGRNVLVARTDAPTGPKRFLSALGGVQLWQALAVGWAVTFGLLGVQTARVASLKGDVREMTDTARANAATAQRWQERADEYREGLVDAANVARQAADALAERDRQAARAAARERSRNREVANVLARSPDPPEWRLRDDSGQTEGDGTTP